MHCWSRIRPRRTGHDQNSTWQGLLLHARQAFTPAGVPLGTVWAEVLNRSDGVSQASASEKAHTRKHTPIEAQETMRWLTGLRAARAVAQQLPAVQCVGVADSEADIYELFVEAWGEHPVDWLIRACQDRALDQEQAHAVRTARRGRSRWKCGRRP